MEMTGTPQMVIHQTGKSFKVLKVTGEKGMSMPEHFSTKEVIVIIQNGSAVLTMKGIDYVLKEHDSFIIPAGEMHSLRINENFQACVIMEVESEIVFNNW